MADRVPEGLRFAADWAFPRARPEVERRALDLELGLDFELARLRLRVLVSASTSAARVPLDWEALRLLVLVVRERRFLRPPSCRLTPSLSSRTVNSLLFLAAFVARGMKSSFQKNLTSCLAVGYAPPLQ